MVKRFTIEPDVDNGAKGTERAVEQPSRYRPTEHKKSESTSSVKYWLVGGLCVGLALGLFTKRR